MDKWESLSLNRRLFDLGSRMGSLEGYLYSEEKVEKGYLKGWLENIDREFKHLPTELKDEIRADYLEVLRKVEALLKRNYGDKDEETLRAAAMVSTLKQGRG